MIEKTFVDRVPTYPGRVRITPVAGAENTFDMERADAAMVEGTELNKAAFDSIIHSRLTGRYYAPTVSTVDISAQTGTISTTNPIPTSGWVAINNTEIKSGSYIVRASSHYIDSNPLTGAVDGSESTRWQSAPDVNAWLMVVLPAQITVKKIKMHVESHSTSWPPVTVLQGSNNGTSWTNLLTVNGRQTALTEFSLTQPGAYQYYRLYFSFPGLENEGGGQARVYAFQFSEYGVYQYRNDFVLSDVPVVWDVGQRITIQTPTNFSTVSVTANRLNDKTINTILQPNKRYELRYNGAAFDAKEV